MDQRASSSDDVNDSSQKKGEKSNDLTNFENFVENV